MNATRYRNALHTALEDVEDLAGELAHVKALSDRRADALNRIEHEHDVIAARIGDIVRATGAKTPEEAFERVKRLREEPKAWASAYSAAQDSMVASGALPGFDAAPPSPGNLRALVSAALDVLAQVRAERGAIAAQLNEAHEEWAIAQARAGDLEDENKRLKIERDEASSKTNGLHGDDGDMGMAKAFIDSHFRKPGGHFVPRRLMFKRSTVYAMYERWMWSIGHEALSASAFYKRINAGDIGVRRKRTAHGRYLLLLPIEGVNCKSLVSRLAVEGDGE